jgi:hypothetical protein
VGELGGLLLSSPVGDLVHCAGICVQECFQAQLETWNAGAFCMVAIAWWWCHLRQRSCFVRPLMLKGPILYFMTES